MPQTPTVSEQERGMRRTEFQTFTDEPSEVVDEVRRVDAIEAMMLRRGIAARGDIVAEREWQEHLNSEELVQIFAGELTDEPEVHAKYFAPTDSMLVVIHRRTPKGRAVRVKRSAFAHTNLRPSFSGWPNMNLSRREKCFDVDARPLHRLEHTVHCIYPGNKSIIRAYNFSQKRRAWCTAYKDGHLIGMRAASAMSGGARGRFKANVLMCFDDDSCLRVSEGPPNARKPDGHGTVIVTNTCTSGLIVEHCSDGSVRQTFNASYRQMQSETKDELSRVIVGAGTVVRTLANGDQEILYANGNVARRAKATPSVDSGPESAKKRGKKAPAVEIPWIMHSFQNGGQRFEKRAGVVDLSTVNTVGLTAYTDAESGERIQSMAASGATIVSRDDGSTLVIHHDGTRILSYTTEGSREVIVERNGYATVLIYANAEKNARLHSSGCRVDISHGGRRKRSSSVLPDGTQIDVMYDSRITATVNGVVRIVKSDGTTVMARDDGTVSTRHRTWHSSTERINGL